MRRILGSLAVRIGIAFLLGLVVLQAAVAVAVLWPDGRPTIFRLVSPREAASIARALEAASPQQQSLIVEALDAGPLIVHLQPDFPSDDTRAVVKNPPYLRKLYGGYASELEGRPFQVQARNDDLVTAYTHGRVGVARAVRLLVRLRTGDVVVIERAPVMLQRLVERFVFIAGAAAIVLLLVMLYCIQQLARPATRLARAAHRLANDIDMPDLPTGGAAEMKMLSIAFNDMKQTIRGLMDERTRILAAIAHDLRTYLTRLRLRADFIDDPDQQARAIRDLDEMGLLLEDTLMFARETTAPRLHLSERIDAGAEIEAFVAMRREIGDPVSCGCAPGDRLLAHCAPLALRRMLANLTDNAVRYGDAAHLTAWRDGEQIRLAIEDSGPGAPPHAFARLMQPFERLEPSRGRQTGGAGLGLAIVKALANSQGGDLTIENRAEGGLRATISLSACDLGPIAVVSDPGAPP